MEIDFEKGNVKIYDKTTKLQTIINKFSTLSGSQIYGFFKNRNVLPPRRINVLALRAVLNEKIKYLNSNSLSKDYFSRLQGYEYFTEHQLYTLFLKIANDKESFKEYKNNYFTLIMLNYKQLALTDGELSYIRNLNKDGNESFEQYFNYITGASIEMLNNFDGVDIDILKDKLYLTASNQEIREIALKYGIDIPSKLTKEEMIDFIANNTNTSEEDINNFKAELEIKTLNELNDYSNENNLGVNSDLTKQSLVNYLFYYLSRCNIETSLIKEIITDSLGDAKKYEPLVFTVELGIISGFKSRNPEKIIHYEGEDKDMDKYNQNLDSKNIDDEEIEQIPEILEEDSTDESLDSITDDVIDNNENSDEALDSITDDVIENNEASNEELDSITTDVLDSNTTNEESIELSKIEAEDSTNNLDNEHILDNESDDLDLNTNEPDDALDSITDDVIEDENKEDNLDDNLGLDTEGADEALDSIDDDIIEENNETPAEEDNLDAATEEATNAEQIEDLASEDTEPQDEIEDNLETSTEESDDANELEETNDLASEDNKPQIEEDNLETSTEESDEAKDEAEEQDNFAGLYNDSQEDSDNQEEIVNNGEELTNEQIEELVRQAQEDKEEEKEEIKENPNKDFISNVELNDMYGSKKMASLAKFSVGKIVAVSILGTIALALIIFFIVGLAR